MTLDNKLNDLPGNEWSFFLRSVINTRYTTSGEEGYAHNIRKIHPSPKPPQLMRDIIKFFTKENEHILDYFMGVGGTLLGASMLKRNALGIDLSSKYISAYKKANKELKLCKDLSVTKLITDFGLNDIQASSVVSWCCMQQRYLKKEEEVL